MSYISCNVKFCVIVFEYFVGEIPLNRIPQLSKKSKVALYIPHTAFTVQCIDILPSCKVTFEIVCA